MHTNISYVSASKFYLARAHARKIASPGSYLELLDRLTFHMPSVQLDPMFDAVVWLMTQVEKFEHFQQQQKRIQDSGSGVLLLFATQISFF